MADVNMRGGSRPPQPPNRKRMENKPSSLLTQEENELLFSLLGKRCCTLSSAVVQLMLSEPPNHTSWRKELTGVACFVRDNEKKSYFIRIFDIDYRRECVWEQELYFTFEYCTPRPYFHTFEADHCMAGLSFANESEAKTFNEAVGEKLRLRAQKKNERRRQSGSNQSGSGSHGGHSVLPGNGSRSASQQPLSVNNNSYYDRQPKDPFSKKKSSKSNKESRPKLTKSDIGLPSNFVHIQHIGWDPTTGFDLDNVSAELKEFFNVVGVSDYQLNDEKTRTFIYDFIESHGGVQKAIESIKAAPIEPQPVAPPPQVPPQQPMRSTSRVPPRPAQPMPTSSSIPPPPPPPPPPTSMTMASLPPPPPPMPTLNNNVGSAPITTSTSNHGGPRGIDPRSALLDQIRQGKQLNKVDSENDSLKSSGSSNGGGDGRDRLLEQIRKGKALKPVDNTERKPSTQTSGGLADALRKALEDRQRMMNASEDEDSSENDSEDEGWDEE